MTDDMLQKLLRLHAEGVAKAKIAEAMGVHPRTVHNWLRREQQKAAADNTTTAPAGAD